MPINFKGSPLFERRGLMLDISRNRVLKIETLKLLIDALSELRYNELQLYTEHTFAYSEHEIAWKDRSPMTAEEIQELDTYCYKRGIELVANQNSFGHMERWLRHARYRPLAECPDGFEHPISGWREFGSTLYPNDESIDFLNTLYSELLPNFRSKYMHIGGDEPWELGKGRSAERVREVGKHRVYLEFMKQVFALADSKGRIPQFWADIILERPDLVPEIPPTAIPVIWGYESDSPFTEQCRTVAEAGFRNNFYVAPGAGNWNSFGSRLAVARANIHNAATAAHATNAKGLLLTAWGDNGHHQPFPSLFPALVLAAYACHGQRIDDDGLAIQIDELFYSGSGAKNGSALCALGKIEGLLPQPLPPSSFLHSAFFADEDTLADLLKLTSTVKLKHCLEMLNSISTEGIDPEIVFGIHLNRHALERCLGIASSYSIANLQKRFAEQWLQTSREGGLQESLTYFERLK